MKIYFACAVQGGRQDQEIYSEIIKHLQQYGEVLTIQLGDKYILHKEDGLTDESIYRRLIDGLEQADVVVAEVTTPSLGVGYEIGYAESLDKEILCLYRNNGERNLSAMIGGNPNVTICWYDTVEEAGEAIDEYFKEIKN